MRRFRHTLALLFLGLAFVPTLLEAQGSGRTHTVRRGDTLWDIAREYLGDPFKWPEIYRRNQDKVQDPNLIYPDQVIIIDGDVAATPGTPPDMPVDTSAPPVEATPAGEPPAMTIFNPARYRVLRSQRSSVALREASTAVRNGDYIQAPFLWDGTGVQGAGSIEATTSSDGIGVTMTDRPIQLYEMLIVKLPEGAAGKKNDRLMLFRYGPTIEGEGRVVIPTGLLRLSTDAAGGRAQAIVLTKFEDVFTSHGVTVLDTLIARPGVVPSRVEFGLKTSLAYVYGDPVLPPVGHQVIFAAGATDGIVPGDQLTMQVELGNDASGQPLPPQSIAVATVTRVTQWGASGIIVSQTDGGVRRGMTAVVTAKMP